MRTASSAAAYSSRPARTTGMCKTVIGNCPPFSTSFSQFSRFSRASWSSAPALVTTSASGLDPDQWSKVAFYEGQGCIECAGTGFRGRTAIHELLDLSDRIREMILLKKPTSEIRRAAREEGMRFLRESAVERVMTGVTTLREINKVTFVE